MDMKKILQAMDNVQSKPVGNSNDIKRSLEIINEASNPHKVSLPVQMAMQHYQEAAPIKESNSLLKKYVAEAEEEINAQKALEQQRIIMYSRKIANRVMEAKDPLAQQTMQKDLQYINDSIEHAKYAKKQAQEIARQIKYDDSHQTIIAQIREVAQSVGINEEAFKYAESNVYEAFSTLESAIYELDEPFDDLIYELESKIDQIQGEYDDLESGQLYEDIDNPQDVVTMDVPLLLRMFEYAREDAKTDMDLHNVTDMLINLSRTGKTLTMSNYDQIVGNQKLLPTNEACWKNYKQIGMKKKGKRMVPNCVPKK